MEVRPGYKQTEVGMIPQEWSVSTISKSMRLINGCAFKPQEWRKQGVPIIRIQNLNDPAADFNYFQGQINERNRVVEGDVLFAWSGTLGSSFGARIWSGPDGVLNQHIFQVIADERVFTKHYSYLIFKRVQEDIEKKSHGFKSSFVHVKKADIDNIQLPIPPLPEQRVIATALSDVDALIGALDRLIAKKRDLKQAAMQQLLTGQTRLPGFSGEWEMKRLGDILRVRHGKSQRNVAVNDGQYPILATGGEIGRTNDLLYDKPSVLIGRKGTIDKPQYQDTPFWTVDTLFYTEVFNNSLPKFVFYKFNMIDWRTYNEASGVPSLNASTIETIEISCPVYDEQLAISTILSDMDAEITTLETRRDKTRALKQGMMQELLTGRIRLV